MPSGRVFLFTRLNSSSGLVGGEKGVFLQNMPEFALGLARLSFNDLSTGLKI